MNAIVQAIDAAVVAHRSEPRRTHLGASQIGGKCARQAWYAFRWAYEEQFDGRKLRLFKRGHDEEHNLVAYLRQAGAEVRDYSERLMYHDGSDSYITYDWDYVPPVYGDGYEELDDVSEDPVHIKRATARGQGPKQWGFSNHDGHFAGSSDGKLSWEGVLPPGWGGGEFKTHNDKSFKLLVAQGVLKSKPVHWVQMQIYMHYLGLTWCLYLAVNKNDDTYHAEIVEYAPEAAHQYVDTALAIIQAKDAPRKLSNDPSWFECKWCAFAGICHYDQLPEKNCRSCAFAEPVADKGWRCGKFHSLIPKEYIPAGCGQWDPVK